jgi:hypothetical protein
MGTVISTIPIGIIVARERVRHPFPDSRWRPVSVIVDSPDARGWRVIRRDDDYSLFHAGPVDLRLTSAESPAYRINLSFGRPVVYIVLSETPPSSPQPVNVAALSASPFEAQRLGETSGLGQVERVEMPPPLVGRLQEFVERCNRGGTPPLDPTALAS